MTRRNSCRVLAAVAVCIVAGCVIAIPYPLPPRGTLVTSEPKLEGLVDSRAAKAKVIEQLGKPVKYRESSMSYRACRQPFGIGLFVVAGAPGSSSGAMGSGELKRRTDCFELLLNFNQDGYLTGYQTRPWPPDVDYLKEDMRLKKFADEGDPIAAQLWLQAAPDENAPGVGVYQEAGIFCPNADLGHGDAQVQIALIYDHGAYGKRVDPVRAWVWYSLASQNGDEAARVRLSSLGDELTPTQLEQAKRQLAAWMPGECMQELTSGQNEPKQFLPPPDGQSALYIYEDTNFGPARPIYVDGQLVGELAPMTYFYKVVTPGKHRISRKPEAGNNELVVDTEPGRNYFIRRYPKAGFFSRSANFELLSADEGQKGMWGCKPARQL